MKVVALVAGGSRKLAAAAPAVELYTSPLFRLNWAYAKSFNPDATLILSAKHGLVAPEAILEPYPTTLERLPVTHLGVWSTLVVRQLAAVADLREDHFVLLAGQHYRKLVEPHLASFEAPMRGMTPERQIGLLQAYRK